MTVPRTPSRKRSTVNTSAPNTPSHSHGTSTSPTKSLKSPSKSPRSRAKAKKETGLRPITNFFKPVSPRSPPRSAAIDSSIGTGPQQQEQQQQKQQQQTSSLLMPKARAKSAKPEKEKQEIKAADEDAMEDCIVVAWQPPSNNRRLRRSLSPNLSSRTSGSIALRKTASEASSRRHATAPVESALASSAATSVSLPNAPQRHQQLLNGSSSQSQPVTLLSPATRSRRDVGAIPEVVIPPMSAEKRKTFLSKAHMCSHNSPISVSSSSSLRALNPSSDDASDRATLDRKGKAPRMEELHCGGSPSSPRTNNGEMTSSKHLSSENGNTLRLHPEPALSPPPVRTSSGTTFGSVEMALGSNPGGRVETSQHSGVAKSPHNVGVEESLDSNDQGISMSDDGEPEASTDGQGAAAEPTASISALAASLSDNLGGFEDMQVDEQEQDSSGDAGVTRPVATVEADDIRSSSSSTVWTSGVVRSSQSPSSFASPSDRLGEDFDFDVGSISAGRTAMDSPRSPVRPFKSPTFSSPTPSPERLSPCPSDGDASKPLTFVERLRLKARQDSRRPSYSDGDVRLETDDGQLMLDSDDDDAAATWEKEIFALCNGALSKSTTSRTSLSSFNDSGSSSSRDVSRKTTPLSSIESHRYGRAPLPSRTVATSTQQKRSTAPLISLLTSTVKKQYGIAHLLQQKRSREQRGMPQAREVADRLAREEEVERIQSQLDAAHVSVARASKGSRKSARTSPFSDAASSARYSPASGFGLSEEEFETESNSDSDSDSSDACAHDGNLPEAVGRLFDEDATKSMATLLKKDREERRKRRRQENSHRMAGPDGWQFWRKAPVPRFVPRLELEAQEKKEWAGLGEAGNERDALLKWIYGEVQRAKSDSPKMLPPSLLAWLMEIVLHGDDSRAYPARKLLVLGFRLRGASMVGDISAMVAKNLLRLGAKTENVVFTEGAANGGNEVLEAEPALLEKKAERLKRVHRERSVKRLLAMLRDLADNRLIGAEEVPPLVQTLVRLSLDVSSVGLAGEFERCLESLFSCAPEPQPICDALVAILKEHSYVFAFDVLHVLPSSLARDRRIRQWLAWRLLVGNDPDIKKASFCERPDLEPLIFRLVDCSTPSSPFYISNSVDIDAPATDYDNLRCAVSILAIALSDIDVHLVEPELGGDDTSQRDAAGRLEKDFGRQRQLEAVIEALRSLHGRISDNRAAYLDRTRAKAAIARLQLRLHFQLPAYTKALFSGSKKFDGVEGKAGQTLLRDFGVAKMSDKRFALSARS